MPIPEKPVVLILEDDPFLALWYEDIIRYAGASELAHPFRPAKQPKNG